MPFFPLFNGNAKFLFYFGAVDGVHGAERYNAAVWNSVMDDAALDAFKIKVVGIHEVH